MVPSRGAPASAWSTSASRATGCGPVDDADLVELATQELEPARPGAGAKVVDGTVIRMPKAYPIYDARVPRSTSTTCATCIDPIPNLHTVGRNGMHKYNNQDHSMLTAMMAVWNMQGATHDIWAVNTDFEYHEEQKIEEPERTRSPPGGSLTCASASTRPAGPTAGATGASRANCCRPWSRLAPG